LRAFFATLPGSNFNIKSWKVCIASKNAPFPYLVWY
jgi:hypothetical protein